jgi:hypothetical protein
MRAPPPPQEEIELGPRSTFLDGAMQIAESSALCFHAWSALKKTKVATDAGGRVVATNQRTEAAREWHAEAGECRGRRNSGVVVCGVSWERCRALRHKIDVPSFLAHTRSLNQPWKKGTDNFCTNLPIYLVVVSANVRSGEEGKMLGAGSQEEIKVRTEEEKGQQGEGGAKVRWGWGRMRCLASSFPSTLCTGVRE